MSSRSGMLTYTIAKERVDRYVDDQLMSDHREAMDCFDCEAYLQLGIDAFRWLVRADLAIRQAIYREIYEYDPEIEEGLKRLFRAWLGPCHDAEEWAKTQQDRGYTVSNLAEFRQCCDEVRAIVKSFDETDADRIMSAPLSLLRDQALQEHRDGKTAEFF